jgi:FlaA1/EpsC-like NDP-sugar epimerase
MKRRVLELPRLNKQAIVAGIDISLSLLATWIAFSLRLDSVHWPEGYQWHVYQLAPLLMLPIFVRLGLYRAVFRYTGISAIVSIAKAVTLYGLVLFAVLVWLALPGVPRSLGVLQPLLLLVLVGGSRAFARLWLSKADSSRRHLRQHRMLVYGAGQLGAQIAEAMERRHQLVLFGFLEDNPELFGKTINGRRVYAASDAASLIESYAITDILLALPSISRARRKEIIEKLRPFHVHIRSVPDFADVAQGKVTVADEHELDILDLLGRDPVLPNPALIGRNITNKVVLVTGAGGSIGSELCRQILESGPSKLLLLDHNEYNLYTIHRDLQQLLARKGGTGTELIPLLGSVRNYARVSQIFRTWRPRTVYHAAAYKHVPLVEHNPVEGIINNVFGTYHVARAAIENNVSDYVLISTDKAVRPTNIMGASKRLAEMVLQSLADSPAPRFLEQPSNVQPLPNSTRFSMVRFGNVLDSSGSVVPLFREQIKAGGPLTLTDPEVTRYFMLIPEAVQLVLQAGAMTEGGDVFVLDMGEPVKIRDLAYRMVELSGLTVRDEVNPEGDIEIRVVGLRPGEKLYEELLIGESPEPTAHPRIMTAHEVFVPWDRLSEKLAQLRVALDAEDIDVIRTLLHEVVNGYQPAAEIVDWSFIEKRRQAMQRQDGLSAARGFEVISKP